MPDKDELIDAQRQVIGILFEVLKRMQENSGLDAQCLDMLASGNADRAEIESIARRRDANAEVIGRLLNQLET